MKRNKTPELKPLFIERMKLLLPNKKDFEDYLEILKKKPLNFIRCNTLKISPSELKKKLEEKSWKISQPWKDYPEVMIVEGKFAPVGDNNNNNNADNNIIKNSGFINNIKGGSERSELLGGNKRGKAEPNLIPLEPGELGRSLEHLLGYYYIQELSSMLPIITLNPKPNEIILDLCASPGSKTTQISALMKNTGTIIANEISFGRLKILASNLERCGCTNVIIAKKDGVAFCQRIKKFFPELRFNKILIDAPCSGEGTLRSSPKTYLMWNSKTIQNLSRLQKSMVASAFEILKEDGELVYSTCTHAPEENEEVVNFMLKQFPNQVEIQKMKLPIKCRSGVTSWNNDKYNSKVKKSCRIYPQDNDTEGFFIAKFKKIR